MISKELDLNFKPKQLPQYWLLALHEVGKAKYNVQCSYQNMVILKKIIIVGWVLPIRLYPTLGHPVDQPAPPSL